MPTNINNTPVHLLNSNINNLHSAIPVHLLHIITNFQTNLRASKVQAVHMDSRVLQAQYQATEQISISLLHHRQAAMVRLPDRVSRLVVPIPQTSTCNLDLLVSLCISLSRSKGKCRRTDLRDRVVNKVRRSQVKVSHLHKLSR